MKSNRRLRRVKTSAEGTGVVSHAGVGVLRELAEGTGLVEAVGDALLDTHQGLPGHAPGQVCADLAVAVADGADAISGIAVLTDRPELLGPVASLPTCWRVLDRVDASHLPAVRAARAAARTRAWAAGAGPSLNSERASSVRLTSQRRLLMLLSNEIDALDVELDRRLKHHPATASAARQGIGPVLAAVFVVQIGEVHRFGTPPRATTTSRRHRPRRRSRRTRPCNGAARSAGPASPASAAAVLLGQLPQDRLVPTAGRRRHQHAGATSNRSPARRTVHSCPSCEVRYYGQQA